MVMLALLLTGWMASQSATVVVPEPLQLVDAQVQHGTQKQDRPPLLMRLLDKLTGWRAAMVILPTGIALGAVLDVLLVLPAISAVAYFIASSLTDETDQQAIPLLLIGWAAVILLVGALAASVFTLLGCGGVVASLVPWVMGEMTRE